MKTGVKKFFKSKFGKALIVILVIALTAGIVMIVLREKKLYRNISVIDTSGTVLAAKGKKEFEAYPNIKLSGGMSLSTAAESFARMTADKEKYLKLEENSVIEFKELGKNNRRKTEIELRGGSLVTELSAPLADGEDLIVKTPNAVLAVRGTMFRTEVASDAGGKIYTDIYTYGGSVSCMKTTGTKNEEMIVEAGKKIRIADGAEPVQKNLSLGEIKDGDLIAMLKAEVNGHKMFCDEKAIQSELSGRNAGIEVYRITGDMKLDYVSFPKNGVVSLSIEGNSTDGKGAEKPYSGTFYVTSGGGKFSPAVSIEDGGLVYDFDHGECSGTITREKGSEYTFSASGRGHVSKPFGEAELFSGELTEGKGKKKYSILSCTAVLSDGEIKIYGTSKLDMKIILQKKDG